MPTSKLIIIITYFLLLVFTKNSSGKNGHWKYFKKLSVFKRKAYVRRQRGPSSFVDATYANPPRR